MNRYKTYTSIIAVISLVLIIAGIANKGLLRSSAFSNSLILEGGESDTLRSGESYVNNGLLANAGLPDICYGDQYPDSGQHWAVFQKKIIHSKLGTANVDQATLDSLIKPKGPDDQCIYTHYPQGSFWITAFLMKICSNGNLGCLRVFPTATGILSLAILAGMLFYAIGPIKSTLMMLAIAYIPLTTKLMPVLYYSSYSFSLLLIQLGILILIFKKNSKFNKLNIGALFLIGFFQGWLTYDYFFIVSLCALPVVLLFTQFQKEDRKRLLIAVSVPVAGFCLAHFLHLIQVVIYYGGVIETFRDLVWTARYRFDDTGGGLSFITERIILVKKYLFTYAVQRGYFNLSLPKLLFLSVVLVGLRQIRFRIKKPMNIGYDWVSFFRNLFVITTAALVSFLWIIVMKQHGTHQFITMHLFLMYFFCILTLLECISNGVKETGRDYQSSSAVDQPVSS